MTMECRAGMLPFFKHPEAGLFNSEAAHIADELGDSE
jgi:hypothetical protein